MSRKEGPRPGLVRLALAGQITNQEGAASADLTIRQFQRLKARYRTEGLRGLLHRRRGHPSPRALPSPLRTRVAELLHSVYRDVNDCHATEKLREVEGLAISRASVRRIRRALGRPAKHRRRPRQHRRFPGNSIPWRARITDSGTYRSLSIAILPQYITTHWAPAALGRRRHAPQRSTPIAARWPDTHVR
jgi:transposase